MQHDANPQASVNLHNSNTPGSRHSPREGFRSYTAVRAVLITYGVAIFGYLFSRTLPLGPASVFGGVPPWGLVLFGVVLQLLMFAGRALVKRHAPDHETASRSLAIIELLGDGVTVLLFALGTYGAILQAADNF